MQLVACGTLPLIQARHTDFQSVFLFKNANVVKQTLDGAVVASKAATEFLRGSDLYLFVRIEGKIVVLDIDTLKTVYVQEQRGEDVTDLDFSKNRVAVLLSGNRLVVDNGVGPDLPGHYHSVRLAINQFLVCLGHTSCLVVED